MKAIISFLFIGALSACSGSPDGFRQETGGGQGGSSDSERANYDEVALTWDVYEEEGSLGLTGNDANTIPADYNLVVNCTLYGMPWGPRSFSKGAGAIVPKDGQNCFATVSPLTATVDNTTLTFQPPSQEPFRSNVQGTQVTYTTASRTHSALVTLSEAFRIDLNSGLARVGFRFAISKDANTSLAMNARSPAITWNYQCGQYNDKVVRPDSGQLAMQLTINGSVCDPKDLKRDIVFVVDVSGSMDDNDRKRGGTCGRYSALRSLLTSLKSSPETRVAIVTFSSGVKAWSKLRSVKESDIENLLYGDLRNTTQRGQLADVVCEADGGTRIGGALAHVSATFVKPLGNSSQEPAGAYFRKNAQKELYLLTDGLPEGEPSGQAQDETNTLKNRIIESYRDGQVELRMGAIFLQPRSRRNNSDATAFLNALIRDSRFIKYADSADQLSQLFRELTINGLKSANWTLTNSKGIRAAQGDRNLNGNVLTFTRDNIGVNTNDEYTLTLEVEDVLNRKTVKSHKLKFEQNP